MNIPDHIAIIPDGNRRWAKGRGMIGVKGHEKATEKEHITELLDEAKALGIEYVSIWGFSSENWNRSKTERVFLFKLIQRSIEDLRDYAHAKKVRFVHLGRKDRLPKELISALENFEKETEKYDTLRVQLLLDYGGQDDIIRATKKIMAQGITDVNEETFLNYLDTKGIPNPDIIIRTGGEKRLSGFLSFQAAYSELYFTDVRFPDFGPIQLRDAIRDFSKRKRNFGS